MKNEYPDDWNPSWHYLRSSQGFRAITFNASCIIDDETFEYSQTHSFAIHDIRDGLVLY